MEWEVAASPVPEEEVLRDHTTEVLRGSTLMTEHSKHLDQPQIAVEYSFVSIWRVQLDRATVISDLHHTK